MHQLGLAVRLSLLIPVILPFGSNEGTRIFSKSLRFKNQIFRN